MWLTLYACIAVGLCAYKSLFQLCGTNGIKRKKMYIKKGKKLLLPAPSIIMMTPCNYVLQFRALLPSTHDVSQGRTKFHYFYFFFHSSIENSFLSRDQSNSDESEPSWLEPQLELKDFRLGSWPFSFQLKIKNRAEILILIFFVFLFSFM